MVVTSPWATAPFCDRTRGSSVDRAAERHSILELLGAWAKTDIGQLLPAGTMSCSITRARLKGTADHQEGSTNGNRWFTSATAACFVGMPSFGLPEADGPDRPLPVERIEMAVNLLPGPDLLALDGGKDDLGVLLDRYGVSGRAHS